MGKANLSPEDRQRIIDMREANPKLKYRVLAAKFGCSVPHIAAIVSGRFGRPKPPKPKAPVPIPHAMPGITLAQLTARR